MKHRREGIWRKLVRFLGCFVDFCTTYAMILPAITQEKETFCGIEEHTHDESCYVDQEQICMEEENHVHGDGCYEYTLTCETAEYEGHVHTDECFMEISVLVCGQEEQAGGQVLVCEIPEGHTHTLLCYSDQTADKENEQKWKRTFADVKLTADWSENVAAIAKTQLGRGVQLIKNKYIQQYTP